MMHPVVVLRALAAFAAIGLTVVSPARAGVITSPSGRFQVGIDVFGNLFDPTPIITNDPARPVHAGTGFLRVGNGYDPIEPFVAREYWGVAAGAVGGYVDPQFSVPPTFNVVPNGAPSFGTNVAAVSTFLNGGSGNVLRVDHTFSLADEGVLRIGVTLTNLTGAAQAVQYRRGVDWDIEPYPNATLLPEEIITVPAPAGQVTSATRNGVDPNPNPLVPYGPFATGPGTFGPADLGAGFTLDLGTLDPVGTPNGRLAVSFDVFHGITDDGETVSDLIDKLRQAGAGYIITGRSSVGENAAALGVVAATPVPEPGTLALVGLGLAAACWRRRRT